MQMAYYSNTRVQNLTIVRRQSQISNFNEVHMSDQNCLTRYGLNPSISRTGPNGKNKPDHGDLLINEKKAFCERKYRKD